MAHLRFAFPPVTVPVCGSRGVCPALSYEDLVTMAGWPAEQYEAWLDNTLITQLIAENRR